MIGKAVVILFIQQKTLSLVFFLNALDQVGCVAVTHEAAVDGKIFLAMPDVLGIPLVEKTLAKRKVMDGIQEVCLAYPVISRKAVDLIGKDQVGQFVIFKI